MDVKNKSKNKRSFKNLLINPRYQLKYTFFITFTGLCMVAMLSVISYSFLRENYRLLIELSPMTEDAKALLIQELRDIAIYLMLASMSFLAVVALTGINMSHRVAGPMYHFKRVFDEVRKGTHSARVRLRPDDEFQDVAQSFNSMLDEIAKPKP